MGGAPRHQHTNTSLHLYLKKKNTTVSVPGVLNLNIHISFIPGSYKLTKAKEVPINYSSQHLFSSVNVA